MDSVYICYVEGCTVYRCETLIGTHVSFILNTRLWLLATRANDQILNMWLKIFQEFLKRIFKKWDTLRIECEILLGRDEHQRWSWQNDLYQIWSKECHRSTVLHMVWLYFIHLLGSEIYIENLYPHRCTNFSN